MADSLERDRAALNRVLSAFTDLQVLLEIIRDQLSLLRARTTFYDLHFDVHNQFTGMTFKDPRDSDTFIAADSGDCVEIRSYCEWLPKHVVKLREAYIEAEHVLAALPARLCSKLDALTKAPWLATVRWKCLDKILKWPGDSHYQTSWASEKISTNVATLLKNAEEHDPIATWWDYVDLLREFGHQAFAIRDAVIPKPDEAGYAEPDSGTEPTPERAALGKERLAVLELIEAEGPIAGKTIASRLDIEESTLRRHYIPALKPFGVQNDRTGDGYYIADKPGNQPQ